MRSRVLFALLARETLRVRSLRVCSRRLAMDAAFFLFSPLLLLVAGAAWRGDAEAETRRRLKLATARLVRTTPMRARGLTGAVR